MIEVTAVDVVVVGAGISGLFVADRLSAAGVRVIVLEARARPGGRLLSAPPALDLGATWYWDGEHRVASLVERFGLATFEQHLDGDTMYEDPNGVRRLAGNLVEAPSRRFTDGAAALADRLASVLPAGTVRYGCPVDTVELDGVDRLLVGAGDRRWRTAHVVLAVPPSLAVATISVPDELPVDLRRVAAATPVWMGQIAKVVAVYSGPFWRADGLAGAGISRVGPMQEIHDMSGPNGSRAALFGFAPAMVIGEHPHDRVTAQLERLFGPSAAQPEQLFIQNWAAERHTVPPTADGQPSPPMSRADYSLYGHASFQQPSLNGRLHWSSTETATRHPGHIEGALEAGERVADAILHTTVHDQKGR